MSIAGYCEEEQKLGCLPSALERSVKHAGCTPSAHGSHVKSIRVCRNSDGNKPLIEGKQLIMMVIGMEARQVRPQRARELRAK